MSHDLFAAFGDETTIKSGLSSQDAWANSTATDSVHASEDWSSFEAQHSPWQDQHTATSQIGGESDGGGDDDFGDFEDASASTKVSSAKEDSTPHSLPPKRQKEPNPSPSSRPVESNPWTQSDNQHPFAGRMAFLFEAGDEEYDAGGDELGDLSNNPEAAMIYSKRIIAEQAAAEEREAPRVSSSKQPSLKSVASNKFQPGPGPNKLKKKSGYVPAAAPEVLFDAENLSEHGDEDFGDFGGYEELGDRANGAAVPSNKATAKTGTTSMPNVDLLGLDDDFSASSATYTSVQYISQRSSAASLEQHQPRHTNATADKQLELEDDAWDDFESAAVPESLSPSSIPSPPPPVPNNSTLSSSQATLPPTNIPPPVILLSIFPSLFAAADDALFNAMGKLDLKQRQMLFGHPASHQFLKGYLGHCSVLAHIIAGRKLRWKRDQHLSQSMRIGPAAAGGRGGMKLTGLDKSEVHKEDREVVDVLRLWRNQIGKLRTAVTAASVTPGMPKLPIVPELAEQMPVKILKATEGGFIAPHACALCGLKREERVGKVDVEVEDSFGEWWVQGMNMHLACTNFWEENEWKLKSR